MKLTEEQLAELDMLESYALRKIEHGTPPDGGMCEVRWPLLFAIMESLRDSRARIEELEGDLEDTGRALERSGQDAHFQHNARLNAERALDNERRNR